MCCFDGSPSCARVSRSARPSPWTNDRSADGPLPPEGCWEDTRTIPQRIGLAAAVLVAAFAAPSTASAVLKTWVGPAAGEWNVDANWSGNAKPTTADDVQIGDANSSFAVTLGTGADAKVRSVGI